MRHAHLLPAFLVMLLLACAPHQANTLSALPIATPATPPKPVLPLSTGIDSRLSLKVGPPDATLEAWVLEPKAGTPVKGTVLFLHGFMGNHLQVHNAGDALRNAGYRTVLVDLRGFGLSTGDHITFGVLDAQDLTQLTDELQRKKLCGPTLGVYGTSYGAASSILYAAADPRVSAVVAVAPFATIREEVPSFSRHALGSAAVMLSDRQLNKLADATAELAGWDLDAAKPVEAIKKVKAPVLLIHGLADTIVPCEASKRIHAANPDATELLLVPNRGHIGLCFDIPGELQAPTRSFFDEKLMPH